MQRKEVFQNGNQSGGITNGLIFVRRIGFLLDGKIWMRGFKIAIINKSAMPGNAQSSVT